MLAKKHVRSGSKGLTRNGFTILETLVAISMSSFAMMATMKLLSFTASASRTSILNSEFNAMASSVGSLLGSPTTCLKSNLIGQNFDGTVPMEFDSIDVNGNSLVRKGPEGGIDVKTLGIDKVISSSTVPGGKKEWVVNFRMGAEKKANGKGSLVGGKNLGQDFNMVLLTDASGKIEQCSGTTVAPSLEDHCKSMSGVFDSTTGMCNLESVVCVKQGGTWDAGTKKCDQSANYYVQSVSPPPGGGVSTQTVQCGSGHVATGGGAQANTAPSVIHTYPVISGGKATGWMCSGANIKTCFVNCQKVVSN